MPSNVHIDMLQGCAQSRDLVHHMMIEISCHHPFIKKCQYLDMSSPLNSASVCLQRVYIGVSPFLFILDSAQVLQVKFCNGFP